MRRSSSTATGVCNASPRPRPTVGEVTREVLAAVRGLGGAVEIDPTPQEVSWSVPLDEDDEHTLYDPGQVAPYFAAATRAALVLAAFRAPYRGRSTPVNAWWGSFDLAVNLFSGLPADPPSQDFIMRNAMDAQEVAIGWWPGDARYGKAAFYAYAHPAPEGFAAATLSPAAARWDAALGEYVLDWDDVRPARTRMRLGSSSPARRSAMPAWCAIGIRRFPPALKGRRRLSRDRRCGSRLARTTSRCFSPNARGSRASAETPERRSERARGARLSRRLLFLEGVA